jgi:hypothetical protein
VTTTQYMSEISDMSTFSDMSRLAAPVGG